MDVSSILATNAVGESGFWRRQFGASRTPGQVVFDLVFGILLPVLCFYADPGVVRGTFATPLGKWSIFIYSFSAVAILTLLIWIVVGLRMSSGRAFFGGVLLAGALVSFSIGIIILPLTLVGILFVIGLLGFVPFLTGFVYLRTGRRAIGSAGTIEPRRFAGVLLSAALALGLPAFAQWRINDIGEQSMNEIVTSDGSVDTAVQRIKRLRLFVDIDKLVWEYEKETDVERKERLRKAYSDITGEEIEVRLRILKD